MELFIENEIIYFEEFELKIKERNIQNIFKSNKKTLLHFLDKATKDRKNRLHRFAKEHTEKYNNFLKLPIGEFLFKLKNSNNEDYKLYLNKYGDNIFCHYCIEYPLNDKGIYCYIVNNEIKYIGRSRKTFKKRINEYGKITAYNCLIDGQATNCHINSKINNFNVVRVGIYKMTEKTDDEIISLEKKILAQKYLEWNIQKR